MPLSVVAVAATATAAGVDVETNRHWDDTTLDGRRECRVVIAVACSTA